jgi:hypothetical protein
MRLRQLKKQHAREETKLNAILASPLYPYYKLEQDS